jgi:hypothetical protein
MILRATPNDPAGGLRGKEGERADGIRRKQSGSHDVMGDQYQAFKNCRTPERITGIRSPFNIELSSIERQIGREVSHPGLNRCG